MKYLIGALILLNVFFVIVMGSFDINYQSNLNKLQDKIDILEKELKNNREEKIKIFLEKYLEIEIENLEEQFKNDKYAAYTYVINEEVQTVILDNNNNLVALNPLDIKVYQ